MCEIYGFCGASPSKLNNYTNEFWLHSKIHQDGFGFYLADKNELYVNPNSAMKYIDKLNKKNFTSKLALCHIRFKTHGPAIQENCHPFYKYDCHGVKWTLVHNGFIDDNAETEALGTMQDGDTDSERILMALVETVNYLYEHSWINDQKEFYKYLFIYLEVAMTELSQLGKTNVIFTDSKTNNMYVFMNHPKTLYKLDTNEGIHISTLPLSKENWIPVEPFKLHVYNNGERIA